MKAHNVILIGMPGAGKSTIGVVLAKRLGLIFIDTDLEIQAREKRHLQEIINHEGLGTFRQIEEQTLLGLDVRGAVISTGGSVIYSEKGMRHLKEKGVCVHLDVPLEELERRIEDMDTRGIMIDPGQSFTDLYHARLPLYRRFADITVTSEGKTVEQLAAEIASLLGQQVEHS